jgi:hypothetical protein
MHMLLGTKMALVILDGSSANKDVYVSMGKGRLGLSEDMLPTSRDTQSVHLHCCPLLFSTYTDIKFQCLCEHIHGGSNAHISWLLFVISTSLCITNSEDVPVIETKVSIAIYVSPKHI